jgi:hypothetical protein
VGGGPVGAGVGAWAMAWFGWGEKGPVPGRVSAFESERVPEDGCACFLFREGAGAWSRSPDESTGLYNLSGGIFLLMGIDLT